MTAVSRNSTTTTADTIIGNGFRGTTRWPGQNCVEAMLSHRASHLSLLQRARPLCGAALVASAVAILACGQAPETSHGRAESAPDEPFRWRETQAGETTLLDSSLPAFPTGLVVFDGREAPGQTPATYDAEQLNMLVRHMGATFHRQVPLLAPNDVAAHTGLAGVFSTLGSVVSTGAYPTMLARGGPGELAMYMDTEQLERRGYYPFTQSYCKSVGLGGPQFTLGKEFIRTTPYPWQKPGDALELAVDLQVAQSELRVRRGGQYVHTTALEPGDHAPIFQSSLFVYLIDQSRGVAVAVLWNLYDPRGPYSMGVGNDRHVFFYTTGIGSTDPSGVDLTQHFTVLAGEHAREPSAGYRSIKVRISHAQLREILAVLAGSTGLSLDPTHYSLSSVGLLNEMNFLYKDVPQNLPPAEREAYTCIADHDPQTFAKVGMRYRNFKATQVAAPTEYRGGLDGIDELGLVRGWACAREDAAPVSVRLATSAGQLAHVTASLAGERAIAEICGAGSAHRFEYRLTPEQLADHGGLRVGASVRGSDPLYTLQTFPGVNYVVPGGPPPELRGLLEGVFLGAGNRVVVTGWACAAGSPATLLVDLATSEGPLATVSANLTSEPGVSAACGGVAGGHRFELVLSGEQVRVLAGQKVVGTLRTLSGSASAPVANADAWPQVVPRFRGGFDGVDEQGLVRGWACALEREAPVQVAFHAGSTFVGQALAAEVAEDAVGVVCEGTSAHRFTFQLTPAQRSALTGATLDVRVTSGGVPVYTLEKYPGVVYAVR